MSNEIKMTRAEALLGLAAVNSIEANYLPLHMDRFVIADLIGGLSTGFDLPKTGGVNLTGMNLKEVKVVSFTDEELDTLTRFVVLFTKLVSSSQLKMMSHGLVRKNDVKLMAKKLLGFNERIQKRSKVLE
jgi:hypothetical protein